MLFRSPTESGSFSMALAATDSDGAIALARFKLTVGCTVTQSSAPQLAFLGFNAPQTFQIAFVRDACAAAAAYRLESSSDLAAWTNDSGSVVSQSITQLDPDNQRVTLTIQANNLPSRFVRVVLDPNP